MSEAANRAAPTPEEFSPMSARPSLIRSVPFWILLIGSLASAVYGTFLVLDKVTTMTNTLADQTATGVEVYAGQSWIVVGAAFIGAGIIGLALTLTVAAVYTILPRPAVAPVEAIDWSAQDAEDEEPVVAAPAVTEVVAAETVVVDEPVAEEPVVEKAAAEEPAVETDDKPLTR
jgi:hypothetical protein